MNNNKTIWIINQYSGSQFHGMEYRHYYLAKEFLKAGHQVMIFSGSFSHLFKIQPDISDSFEFQNIDGITYCWVKIPKYKKSVSLGRFINMMAFAWKLRQFKIDNYPKPDAIIVSSPSLFPVVTARNWAKRLNAKMIFEIRDIWPLTLQELSGLKTWHPLNLVLAFFEKYGYAKADKIVTLLPDAFLHFKKFNVAPEKVFTIPNGIFIDENEKSEKFDLNLPNEKYIVGYLGSIGKSNALDYLIHAINQLKSNENLYFVLVGKGAEKERLQNLITNPNVKWFDAVDKVFVPSVLAQFDICYIGWHNIKLYEMGISANKIFDYMYAAKPIIHSNNASNDLIKIANCGISVAAEDAQEIADAILKLANMSSSERQKMGQNGKDFVMKNHTYKKLANDYISII